MMIALVYLSFVLDFLVYPIPSEASTLTVDRDFKTTNSKRLMLWLAHALVLATWTYPLYVALLHPGIRMASPTLWWFGLLLALLGRVVTLSASRQLRQSDVPLEMSGLFALSRHPIVCGLHITLAGLLLTTAQPVCLFAYLFTLLYFDYKTDLEEKTVENALPDYRNYRKRCTRYPFNLSGFNWHRPATD